jgi:2-hydroxy-6-oxonona-2,4-dienedioate hydrolase
MTSAWVDLMNIPFELAYRNAGGVRTRSLEAGSGEPLIFLHGTGGHLEAFTRNIAVHADHFRVYAIDMVGHGFSDKPDAPYTIPYYVDHLLKFMDAMQIDAAHISGESLGGWVGAWLAMEHPDRVKRLVLNTAGGLVANPEVMTRIKTSSRAAVNNPTREAVRKRLEWLMKDPTIVSDELVEMRYRIYAQPGFADVMERILCLQEMDVRQKYLFTPEMIHRITAKTLVLWTTHDPTCPADVGRVFAANISGAQFVVMQDCGHWPQFEDAEEFNRLHLKFLTE